MTSVAPQNTSTFNSTIVRFKKSIAPMLLRRSFPWLERLTPRLAARFAQRLFFTPPRAPLREDERRILATAARATLAGDAGRLAYWRLGSGPRVLLVHGWGGHAGQMTAIAEALAAQGYEAVLLDLPGHGLSSGDRASIVHFSRAIEQIAQHLGALHAVIAHSLGTTAVTLSLGRGLQAGRAVFFAPPARFDAIWARFRDGLGMSASGWQRVEHRASAWLGVAFADVEPLRIAPRLRTPLLMIHGDADREVLISESQLLQWHWPEARLLGVAGMGHLRVLRDADSLAAALMFIGTDQPR